MVLYLVSLAGCICFSYVILLYAFDYNGFDRNNPRSIKRRFIAAVINNFFAIVITYNVLNEVFSILKNYIHIFIYI